MHRNNGGYKTKDGNKVDWINYYCGTYAVYGKDSNLCTFTLSEKQNL
jgi:hypothetical protein